jgi:hypothetical protein
LNARKRPPRRIVVAAALGNEEHGPSNRWYQRVQTPDCQVVELYRDTAARDVLVLDRAHD